MSGKKTLLAGVLRRSGCLRLLRHAGSGRLVVFNYHRIRPDGPALPSPFDEGVFGPTISVFARQVAWLQRHTRILSEEGLIQAIRSRRVPHGLSTMITFDDGYRDNYTLALPVLRRLDVPAVFFIPTDPIESRRLGWWDLIAYLIKRTRRSHLDIDGARVEVHNDRRSEAIRAVQRLMKTQPAQVTGSLVARLAEACDAALPSAALQDRELMTWDEIRDVARCGFGIGSHTHTHRVLATLSAAEQEEELRLSKMILERHMGRPVKSIAYPVGGYQHFTRQTQVIAARCGYALGFSFNTFVNEWQSLREFDIKRIEGPDSVSLLAAGSVLPRVFARWN